MGEESGLDFGLSTDENMQVAIDILGKHEGNTTNTTKDRNINQRCLMCSQDGSKHLPSDPKDFLKLAWPDKPKSEEGVHSLHTVNEFVCYANTLGFLPNPQSLTPNLLCESHHVLCPVNHLPTSANHGPNVMSARTGEGIT